MRRFRAAVAAAAVVVLATPSAALADGAPAPLDPQNWTWQDELTWNDYKALPGTDYSDPSVEPSVKKWKVALVVTDFPGTPFTITQPQGGTVFGTPTSEANTIPRDQVATFYRDFLNRPQPLNHFQTMNRYWMEDSFGRYGVQLDAFGPYQLPGTQYQYFLNDITGNDENCPTPAQTPCDDLDFRDDARAAWEADVGEEVADSYDNIFFVSAGEDESSTWQEFGEMKWMTPEEVPDAFGPDAFDATLPNNWANTRYVPWTSWVSAATNWPNARGNTSVEAESSGMSTYAHELSHNLSIPDNYGNPYSPIQQRGFTGMWDMMSRGTFNGPGGPHTRFLVPATQGSSLGSQHNIHNKRTLNFVDDDDLMRLNRDGLAQSGIAVADVTAREVPHSDGEIAGVRIELDGAGDQSPPCDYRTNWLCDGVRQNSNGSISGRYDAYTMEVVQQIGSDSFDPGHGVLITKVKNRSSSCGNARCFAWVIDSHPEDIGHIDFIRPDGTPAMATLGDERQLNDASFNAGLDSGSSYEWVDEANRLHFYVIDKRTDERGILHYKVAVRSLEGAGPQGRGVALQSGGATEVETGQWSTCTFTLKNTGAAAAVPDVHPQDSSAFLGSDVYRLSASATGAGWTAKLRNALAAVEFGQSVSVPVYVTKDTGASADGTVALTATSESDPSVTQTAVCGLASGDVGGTVPATLALTLGTPASFGAFLPGVGKDYAAETTANVISSAGDAVLSVSDASPTATGHLVNGAFALDQALQAQASSPAAGPAGAFAPVGGSSSPTTLATWTTPVANDGVTIGFKQTILASEPLRTGAYAKTLTFTLSTTNP